MSPKLKNILIFVGIGLVLVVLYIVLFNKKPEDTSALVSSSDQQQSQGNIPKAGLQDENSQIAKEFLAELLSIKSLQLDDAIFAGPVFSSLKDPDVLIIQDEKEGRPNPFAPIGFGSTPTPTTPIIPAETTPAVVPSTTPSGTVTPSVTTPSSTTPPKSTTPATPSSTVPPKAPVN